MLGIEREFSAFLCAGLTGVQVSAAYLALRVLRRMIRHSLWAVNLEDGVFWVGTSVYLFMQIYHTSSGIIRWYFVLGVLVGVLLMGISVSLLKKCRKNKDNS